MKRTAFVWLIVGAFLAVLVVWISRNTYWADLSVPMPLKGEAARNPFYSAQRFAEQLGARTAWDRELTIPSTDAVIVLSDWHWSLIARRRQALEHWVESGGRLVVDGSLIAEQEFAQWSGIVRKIDLEKLKEKDREEPEDCRTFQQEHGASQGSPESYSICNVFGLSFLTSNETPAWSLRDESQTQAMRVRRGRGSVTVVNANPFGGRDLFEGDHARLFVAAAQLRRGDDIHFLSENDHASLLTLLWRYGSPVVVLSLVLVALALWRGWIRFGPPAPRLSAARRSLAEQIRGTGQFALKQGSGEALHAASVRALDEAAERRLPGFARLPAEERAAALEGLTGFDRHGLAEAIYHPRLRRPHELRSTIARIEGARRQILADTKRFSHGTH
jgi:hypothetical protein